ncbi:hypothetical protein [Oceanobacter antarcticus]|uniref:Uncharacterized protein n=1 Tax=Oceanobacter antarcticus TaxID=3133425 RepID=A0ABW8NLN2_9GAMM
MAEKPNRLLDGGSLINGITGSCMIAKPAWLTADLSKKQITNQLSTPAIDAKPDDTLSMSKPVRVRYADNAKPAKIQ